jgi:hypothetical protein
MRTIVGGALIALLLLLALPLLQELAIQLAGADPFYENAASVISPFAERARRIIDNPAFNYALTFIGGMTFATLADAFFKKAEQRQSTNRALLGDKASRLGRLIQMELQRSYGGATMRRRLCWRVNALMIDLERAGMPVPHRPKGMELDKWFEMAAVYFSHIGPLLRDGHYSEARGIAALVQRGFRSSGSTKLRMDDKREMPQASEAPQIVLPERSRPHTA